jgi:hypothetical protein
VSGSVDVPGSDDVPADVPCALVPAVPVSGSSLVGRLVAGSLPAVVVDAAPDASSSPQPTSSAALTAHHPRARRHLRSTPQTSRPVNARGGDRQVRGDRSFRTGATWAEP